MNLNMVKYEKCDDLHLVYYFAVPLRRYMNLLLCSV